MSSMGTDPAPPQPSAPALPGSASPHGYPSGSRPWSLSRHGVSTVTRLELRQRVRSTRWIVSLAVFALVVGGVTTLTWAVARQTEAAGSSTGPAMFGFIVFFVLFLGLLVSPTLSATSINGDRAAGTLATLQVTLLSAAEIVVGKLLAAWIASLAFLAVSVPFIVWAFATGGTPAVAVLTTLLLLAVLLAVVCAIGLGFSALTPRTAGSAVLTYVAVASLTFLSLIVFGLTLPLVTTTETVPVYEQRWGSTPPEIDETGAVVEPPPPCTWAEQEMPVTHTERTWWLLAINPFVIVADAAPGPVAGDRSYGSVDPLSAIRDGVRTARLGPPESYDYCWQELEHDEGMGPGGHRTDGDTRGLSPVWPWGLVVYGLLAAGAVAVAVRRLTIPMRTLPAGTRVA